MSATSFGTFFDNAKTPLAVLDPAGTLIALNGAWTSVIEDTATARGKAFEQIFVGADAERVRNAVAQLRPEAPEALEARLAASGTPSSGRRARIHLSKEDGSGQIQVTVIVDPAEDARAQHEALTIRLLDHVLESAPVFLWAMDRDGTCTISQGKALAAMGLKSGQMVGVNLFQAFAGNEEVLAAVRGALDGKESNSITSPIPGVTFEGLNIPLRASPDGEVTGVIGFGIDVSARMNTETELREKLALIERQSATIRALGTPIIQVWDEVLCVPVIGTVDSARTAEMMESLLDAIVRLRARFAIIDLTGVELVDTSTADHLLGIFRAAKVLGVEGVLCGIRPNVAQTVVGLGVDIASVRTMRTLREALKWCMDVRAQA